jgi:hypothetical protein
MQIYNELNEPEIVIKIKYKPAVAQPTSTRERRQNASRAIIPGIN